jgi:Ca-activated chloride channel family protein
VPINSVETALSASAKPPASKSAVVARLQARHATALRSYALELWDGRTKRADESLAELWREWTLAPPLAEDATAREAIFAALRRHVVAAQRRAGARAETAQDGELANAEQSGSVPERVAHRFRQLTPKQQEVLRLRLRHNFGVDEIAHITELAPANVEQLIHHALGRLDGGGPDDPRLTRLALTSAAAGDTADAPADRARIAELRVTAEVARQVLARGVETFVTHKKRRSRRRFFVIGGALVLAALAVAAWWMMRRPAESAAASRTLAATGSSRVAIARTNGDQPDATPRAAGGAEAAGHQRGVQPRASATAGDAASTHAKPEASQPGSAESPHPPATASAMRSGIPTGEVGRNEPLAQPRGTTSDEKVVAPPAQPLGRHEINVAPPQTPAARTEPATPETSAPRNPDREASVMPRTPPDSPRPTDPRDPAPESQAPLTPAPSLAASPSIAAADATLRREPPESKALTPDRLDTAPIAALRKALSASHWPESQNVNVRALMNAAPPSAQPPAANAVSVRVESSESPWHPERKLVRVELRAREATPPPRPAATVILLLDVSGSMDAPNRLPLVQEAVAALLRRLRPEDRVGVVTYAGESRVLLPPTVLTNERALRAAIDALEAKGRTNGGAGLREAFALAEADGRGHGEHIVLLCTDGDFNMGETSEAELGALVDQHRDAGVRLAIFGFGRPQRIDARLEALAARARGGSGYVNTRAEAEQALVAQLEPLFAPVAEKLEATVAFDPARVARFRAVGERELRTVARGTETRVAARERLLPGETVSAMFEVEPAPGAAGEPGAADLRVRTTCVAVGEADAKSPAHGLWPARLGDAAFAEASVDFRFAAAMAAFGEALQAGPEEGAPRLDEIERWARDAVGEDAGGYRAELLALIAQGRHAAKR